MEINIICVGGVKQSFYKDACADYLKRLKSFARVTVTEIREHSHLPEKQGLTAESALILPKLSGIVTVTDINGQLTDSAGLAGIISAHMNAGNSSFSYVIGGSNGLDTSVLDAAHCRLSFSRMTFPHTLFRVMLLEQLYRAFSIINGLPYHK